MLSADTYRASGSRVQYACNVLSYHMIDPPGADVECNPAIVLSTQDRKDKHQGNFVHVVASVCV